jgi:hypothetical protein
VDLHFIHMEVGILSVKPLQWNERAQIRAGIGSSAARLTATAHGKRSQADDIQDPGERACRFHCALVSSAVPSK